MDAGDCRGKGGHEFSRTGVRFPYLFATHLPAFEKVVVEEMEVLQAVDVRAL